MPKYKEYSGLWALSKEKQRILSDQKKYNQKVAMQLGELDRAIKILSTRERTEKNKQ